jgi:hypothetical protein
MFTLPVHSTTAITQPEADKQGQGATARRGQQHRQGAPRDWCELSRHGRRYRQQELPRKGVTEQTGRTQDFPQEPACGLFAQGVPDMFPLIRANVTTMGANRQG